MLGPPSLGPQRPGVWSRVGNMPTPPGPVPDKDKKPSRSSSSGSKRGDKNAGGRGSGSGPKRTSSSEKASALEAVAKITNNPSPKPGRSTASPVRAPPPESDTLDEETVRRKTVTIIDELADNNDIKVGSLLFNTSGPTFINTVTHNVYRSSKSHHTPIT